MSEIVCELTWSNLSKDVKLIEQKGMTFDLVFGYSFSSPFSSLFLKEGRKSRMNSKDRDFKSCISARSVKLNNSVRLNCNCFYLPYNFMYFDNPPYPIKRATLAGTPSIRLQSGSSSILKAQAFCTRLHCSYI